MNMANTSIASLIKLDEEYQKHTDSVSDCFQCAWDDSVHDSYSLLIKQIKENADKIHTIRQEIETIVSDTECMNIDGLIKRTGELCREAETI